MIESEERIKARERKISLYLIGIIIDIIGVFVAAFAFCGSGVTLWESIYMILIQAAGGCFFGYMIKVESTRAAHDVRRGALW